MNQSSKSAARCRLCLRLVDSQELMAMLYEDPPGPLHSFAQKLLSDEFALNSPQFCSDCFSMWNMMQDFLNSCLRANEVLRLSKHVALRKAWVGCDDEQRMFIEVCRVVKRHFNEMGKLLCTLQPETWVPSKPTMSVPQSSPEINKTHPAVTKRENVRTYRKNNPVVDPDRNAPVPVMLEKIEPLEVKEEAPLDIDDSSAFVSDEQSSLLMHVNYNLQAEPETDSCDVDTTEHAITVVEPEIDQIDLLDSSSGEDDAVVDQKEGGSRKKKTAIRFDEEKLKNICQVCGIKTDNMAAHLEMHIRRPSEKKKMGPRQVNTAPKSRVKIVKKEPRVMPITKKSSLLQRAELQSGTLQCQVCGIGMSNLLVARIHARSHASGNLYSVKNPSKDWVYEK
ncbi:uncharacterized protein LOC131676435 [Topomyia yanbarensis]|uniref:uncharacterized protein LOC131676435 n=1 Tax=Topomyia yanbarensis TaxID=2498891 RepID=UPI00273B9D0C|nr:uncharacterized protein LOC131676435 [Topomyia yanbarensis]